MPRASQMPRTRRVQRWQAATRVGVLLLLTLGAGVAKSAAGDSWWWTLLIFVAFAAGLVVVATRLSTWLRARYQDAYRADLAELDPAARELPYGVVRDGADILFPTKAGMVGLVVFLAVLLAAGGAAMLTVDDVAARVFGALMVLLGLWCGVLAWWVRGARIRLTPDGLESTMGPRKFYRWIQIPEIKVDRLIVIVKAAGVPRPRIWIRCGVLEVSVSDAVAMIRRQRSW